MNRWKITDKGIEWDVASGGSLPHRDHLECSGELASLILTYGVAEDGSLTLVQHPVFPQLRTIPDNTHGSFQLDLKLEDLPQLTIGGEVLVEEPTSFSWDGMLTIRSRVRGHEGMEVERVVSPSVDAMGFVNQLVIYGIGDTELGIRGNDRVHVGRGARGVYLVECSLSEVPRHVREDWDYCVFSLSVTARIANDSRVTLSAWVEIMKRMARVDEMTAPLQLNTGDAVVDTAFRLAKLRACESIFRTRGGLMHSPGGGSYYAATWCNDQVEYAGPWFAWTNDRLAMEASQNAYEHYMPFMGPNYHRIPSSVISEGTDIWEGAGDRGDAAMYAYGASLFALVSGDRERAWKLWPGIQWTLEYCRRKLNVVGVVESDSDELEGRFPSGSANLCTSSLYYGGLRQASCLAVDLGLTPVAEEYGHQADELRRSIESYFGWELHGFKTYRYYEGNTKLRSWIGIPLCMGIFDRTEDTIAAMYSPHLWFHDGMLSQEGEKTYWDRSLLYGLRGAFAAGETKMTFEKLRTYSEHRLLGDHVPYPFEAWPEGAKRHLSAESALYCRIITEGIFGLRPLSLNSLEVRPHLPDGIDHMSLKDIRAFGRRFDILVDRNAVIVSDGDRRFVLPANGGTVAW